MDDLLPLFDDHEHAQSVPAPSTNALTGSQREALRKAFASLGILSARAQFEMVEELTGQRITSVLDLREQHAQTLIHRLADKVNSLERKNTGNAWDDREEDTWIDKL
jgi:hypothetical protein